MMMPGQMSIYDYLDRKPERKRGTWEVIKTGAVIDFRCSACHRFRFHNGELRRYNYCPICGAYMREGIE